VWQTLAMLGRLDAGVKSEATDLAKRNNKATVSRGFLNLVGRARFELATNGLKVDITNCFY